MIESLPLLIDRLNTPIGEVLVVADLDGNLRAVDWSDHETRMHCILRHLYGESGFRLESARNPNDLTRTIARYFEGN
jgi:methylated-DNA-[protein]-cysteine S-methyltransferase